MPTLPKVLRNVFFVYGPNYTFVEEALTICLSFCN